MLFKVGYFWTSGWTNCVAKNHTCVLDAKIKEEVQGT